MGVVRLLGADDALARRELPGDPERLQVGDCAAGGQMAQKFCPTEDGGDLPDGLNLHLRAGPASVAGVVVGIDRHGQRIGGPRHRMRRLEHLSGIERMKVGIVVAEAAGYLIENRRQGIRAESGIKVGQGSELLFQSLCGLREQRGNGILRHGNPPG